MANFYGTVQGNRGAASRLGHRDLRVTAQSYEGNIIVELIKTEEGDKVSLSVQSHYTDTGTYKATLLYHGFIKDLLSMEARTAQMHALGVQKFTEGHFND